MAKVVSARALPIAIADFVAGVAAGKVGVIAPEAQLPPILAALRERGLGAGRGSSDGLRHRVTVLDPVTSKGLEFDHVVVVEPSTIARRSAREKRRLFVALTRATKTLTLVHANLLPPALRGGIESQLLEVELPPSARRARPWAPTKKAARRSPARSRTGGESPEPAAEATQEDADTATTIPPVGMSAETLRVEGRYGEEAPVKEVPPRRPRPTSRRHRPRRACPAGRAGSARWTSAPNRAPPPRWSAGHAGRSRSSDRCPGGSRSARRAAPRAGSSTATCAGERSGPDRPGARVEAIAARLPAARRDGGLR